MNQQLVSACAVVVLLVIIQPTPFAAVSSTSISLEAPLLMYVSSNISLHASLSSFVDEGNVTFQELLSNFTYYTLTTVRPINGTASFNYTTSSAGIHQFRASYTDPIANTISYSQVVNTTFVPLNVADLPVEVITLQAQNENLSAQLLTTQQNLQIANRQIAQLNTELSLSFINFTQLKSENISLNNTISVLTEVTDSYVAQIELLRSVVSNSFRLTNILIVVVMILSSFLGLSFYWRSAKRP